MFANKTDQEQDNIETVEGLADTLTEWLESIEGPFDDYDESRVEFNEFRSCSGFIPFARNKGSVDLFSLSSIPYLIGSGYTPLSIQDEVQGFYDDSIANIMSDNPNMSEIEASDTYSEESNEYDEIAFRVRCMYEGNGVLCVYAGYDFDAPYFRWKGKAKFFKELNFTDIDDLKKQLALIIEDVENV